MKASEQKARLRHISLQFKAQFCEYCACVIDGSIYHDCKEGKLKHLCLNLTNLNKDEISKLKELDGGAPHEV